MARLGRRRRARDVDRPCRLRSPATVLVCCDNRVRMTRSLAHGWLPMHAEAHASPSESREDAAIARTGAGKFFVACVFCILFAASVNYVILASFEVISWHASTRVMMAVLLSGATAGASLMAAVSAFELRRTRRQRLATLAQGTRLLDEARARARGDGEPSSEAAIDAVLTRLRHRHLLRYDAFVKK